ncbi:MULTISPECIES: OB-fold protein [unclassified Prochlorococcus]|uniref:OB-fold protein n=1 Tax=unclassified Prochlorococcus TaxID=2627481 RepID=UPI00187BF961|nr:MULTISPECIES: hypothetical protein [unclassified Prochlorococcus]
MSGSSSASNDKDKKEYSIDDAEMVKTIAGLSEEFEQNSVRAENAYMGRIIAFDGIVNSIDDSPFGDNSAIVSIRDPSSSEYTLEGFDCRHKRDDVAIVSLNKGEFVSVVGKLKSETMGLSFAGCTYNLDGVGSFQRFDAAEYERNQKLSMEKMVKLRNSLSEFTVDDACGKSKILEDCDGGVSKSADKKNYMIVWNSKFADPRYRQDENGIEVAIKEDGEFKRYMGSWENSRNSLRVYFNPYGRVVVYADNKGDFSLSPSSMGPAKMSFGSSNAETVFVHNLGAQ